MTDPTAVTLAITLDGGSILAKVNSKIVISDTLTNRANTCKFTIKDTSGLTLTKWSELIITGNGNKLFGGYFLEDDAKKFGDGEQMDLSFSDYGILLEKVRIKAEYENRTDAYIIGDLVTNYLPGGWDGSTHVNAIQTHDIKRFNRISIAEALTILAEEASADWYVDYDKKIHFFTSEENIAPFSVSNDIGSIDYSTVVPYSDFLKKGTAANVVNRVEVVGGVYLSDDAVFYIPGTGQDNRIILPFKMHEPSTGGGVVLERNDGTEGTPSWTTLTTKVGYIDSLSSTDDALLYYNEKVVEQIDNWPSLTNALRVTGRYDVPLRVRVRDEYSKDLYDAGVYFDAVIVDKDITTKLAGKIAAKALLAQNSLERITLTFSVMDHGLVSGQILSVYNSYHSIDDEFLIRQVNLEIIPSGFITYKISCGAYNPDLLDMIIALSRATEKRPDWKDDEVLDEVLDQSELVALTEGSPAYALGSYPYNWGSDTDELVWDFGKWMST